VVRAGARDKDRAPARVGLPSGGHFRFAAAPFAAAGAGFMTLPAAGFIAAVVVALPAEAVPFAVALPAAGIAGFAVVFAFVVVGFAAIGVVSA
jgi:hypothetical protein